MVYLLLGSGRVALPVNVWLCTVLGQHPVCRPTGMGSSLVVLWLWLVTDLEGVIGPGDLSDDG